MVFTCTKSNMNSCFFFWKLIQCIQPHSICVSLITQKRRPCSSGAVLKKLWWVWQWWSNSKWVPWLSEPKALVIALQCRPTGCWVEWGGWGGWWYFDIIQKLSHDFSKQLLYCHCWKWGVKFRSLKNMQLHPELTGMTIHSIVTYSLNDALWISQHSRIQFVQRSKNSAKCEGYISSQKILVRK